MSSRTDKAPSLAPREENKLRNFTILTANHYINFATFLFSTEASTPSEECTMSHRETAGTLHALLLGKLENSLGQNAYVKKLEELVQL